MTDSIILDRLEALAKAASPAPNVFRPDSFRELADVCREAVPTLIARVRELEAQVQAMQPRPIAEAALKGMDE